MEGDYLLQAAYLEGMSQRFDSPATFMGGNAENHSVTQQQADEPQVMQKPMHASPSTMQPIDSSTTQPCLTQSQNNHQFEQWNVLPSVQQRNQIQNAGLQGPSHMSNTYFYCQPSTAEIMHGIQSPLTTTTDSSAFASIPVAQNTSAFDWKILITKYQRVKSAYLPVLIKLHKTAGEQCLQNAFQGQNVKQFQAAEHCRAICQRMMTFLNLSECELVMKFPKKNVHQLLNKIVHYCRIQLHQVQQPAYCSNQLSEKSVMSSGSQMQQPSNGEIRLNSGPITPSAHKIQIEESMVSSSPRQSSLDSPITSDVHAKKQVNKKTVLQHSPKGTATNAVTDCNQFSERSNFSGGSQGPQPSNVQIHLNDGPFTASAHTTLRNKSMASSCVQPTSLKSSVRSDAYVKKQANKETLSQQGSKGTADNAFCSNRLDDKSTMSGPTQVPQPSDTRTYLKNVQVTPSEHTLLQPNTCSKAQVKKQVNKETLLQQGPKDTADNAHLNVEKNPILSQSSSENQPLLVPQRKRTKVVKKADLMNIKLPQSSPAKTVQKKNKSSDMDHKEISQPKPMKATIDSPSTPVSPLSAPKELGKSAKQPSERLAKVDSKRFSKRSIFSGGSQEPQPSNVQIHLNDDPFTASAHTTLMNKSLASSCVQPTSLNSSVRSDAHVKKQANKETLLQQGSKGTADNACCKSTMSGPSQVPQPSDRRTHLKNVQPTPSEHTLLRPTCSDAHLKKQHFNVEKHQVFSQSSSENQPPMAPQSNKRKKLVEKKGDVMDSMFLPTPTKLRSAKAKSAKLPQVSPAKTVQIKNKSSDMEHKAISQPKPMKATVDSPSTPVSPLSAPTELGKSAKQPSERLAEVIQSTSKEALTSAIDDIAAAMKALDKLPEYANYDVDPNHSQVICSQKILKRDIESVGVLDSSGSCTKRARNELDRYLMNEISEINEGLIETVVELDTAPDFDLNSRNKMIVKCTYKPLPFSESLAVRSASIASVTPLSIKLLIPSEYPSSPPQIIQELPAVFCDESIGWLERVHLRFDRRVRGLVSVKEMAQAWNDSARSVFSDFVHSVGGGSFSSKYGTWDCIPTVR